MANDKPIGQRFSEVYVERGTATEDSVTLRSRLGHFVANQNVYTRSVVVAALRQEIGASVYDSGIVDFFVECPHQDFLDSITIVHDALIPFRSKDYLNPTAWVGFAQKAFKKENVAYTVDSSGGVHPAHDEEFDVSRRATVALLDKPRYSAARQFFDQAIADLKQPRDTRDAVRKTFEALENIAKLMCPGEIVRLGATEVKRYLQPIALNGTTGAERNATSRMIESIAEWTNACQQYRHAAGEPEPDAPSLDLALLLVSTGAAYLRWLVALDNKLSETATE